MRVLFPSDPLTSRRPDSDYLPEWEAAQAAGLSASVVEYEALEEPDRAVRLVAPADELALLRGWMMTPPQYHALHRALTALGLRMVTSPDAYRTAHWLPGWYPFLEGSTPRTVWGEGDLLERLGPGPAIVKDYVKSRKHEWAEACFIPSAADRAHAEAVIRRFLDLQGPDLAGGVVLREFVELEGQGAHPRSGMPRVREYRLFLLDARLLCGFGYWTGQDPLPPDLPLATFESLAARLPARFVAMDVARRTDGRWIVVEVGDGQVSALPDDADPVPFYQALKERL